MPTSRKIANVPNTDVAAVIGDAESAGGTATAFDNGDGTSTVVAIFPDPGPPPDTVAGPAAAPSAGPGAAELLASAAAAHMSAASAHTSAANAHTLAASIVGPRATAAAAPATAPRKLADVAAPTQLHDLDGGQVKELQQALLALGYPVGPVDGDVGKRTENAWAEFRADVTGGDPAVVDAAAVAALNTEIQKKMQVGAHDFDTEDGTIAAIVAECGRQGLGLRAQAAYVLATVKHETAGTFRPVKEAFFLGARAEAFRRTLKYFPYFGRGYVQLTHDFNYKTYSVLTGKDLLNDPDLAMDPPVALFVLVDGFKFGRFTGRKLSDFVSAPRQDFVNARRCINGTDRADDIADIAEDFLAKLSGQPEPGQ